MTTKRVSAPWAGNVALSPERTVPARRLDGIEAVFLAMFALLACVSWTAITLAELHLFRASLVGSAAAVLCACTAWLMWRDLRGYVAAGLRVNAAECCALAVLLLVAGALFFHPGDYLVNGGDASMYLAMGEIIAKKGGLTFVDPLLEIIPESARSVLFSLDSNWPPLFNRFPGGLQIADDHSVIVLNFFHLFPTWIAIFTLLFGPGSGIFVNPATAVLGVWAVWLLGRRLSSPMTGWIAAALLVVNFGEIWFARYSSSELLCQFLVLAGLVCTAIAVDEGPQTSGACAGAAFGLAAFCRIDVLFLVTPFVMAFLVIAKLVARFPSWRVYTLVLTGLTVQATVHGLTFSQPYVLRIMGEVSGWLRAGAVVGSAAAALLVALAWAAWRFGFPHQRRRSTAVHALAALAFAVAVFLSFRTAMGPLGILISPLAVFLACAGVGLMLTSDASIRALPVLAVFLGSSFVYLGLVRAIWMPMVFRRLVPVVLPLALLFAAHCIWRLVNTRRPLARFALVIPLGLAVFFLRASWAILLEPPMQDVRPQIARLAERLPQDALVLVDRWTVSQIGLALNYAFDRESLVVPRTDVANQALAALVESVIGRGRQVFAVTEAGPTEGAETLRRSDLRRFEVRPAGADDLRLVQLRSSDTELPRNVAVTNRHVETYEILSRPPVSSRAPLPLLIDVGSTDFAALLRGFYARENMPTARARWTRGEAEILLGGIEAREDAQVTLTVRMAGWRPTGLSRPRSAVSIGDHLVGEVQGVGPGFGEYHFRLDREALRRIGTEDAVLRVVSETFVPKASGAGDDRRTLGVAIDWIRIGEVEGDN